jgi:hypothetical protein
VVTWTAIPTGETPTGGNLLAWNVILSAGAAAFGGARAWSGWRNQNLLVKALALTAQLPPTNAHTADAIRTAPTVDASAMRATGRAIPGVAATPAPVPDRAEAQLNELFDRARLKEQLTALGQPLVPDANGVTAESLDAFQTMRTSLRLALKGLPLAGIAGMTLNEFLLNLGGRGVDVVGCRSVLEPVHAGAVAAMAALRAMPEGWSLPADHLN